VSITDTLTAVGVLDTITTKGPSNGVLMVEYFILFLPNHHGNNILSVYMSKKTRFKKKLKPLSLSIKGHVYSQ
jgi:hypothetical protein